MKNWRNYFPSMDGIALFSLFATIGMFALLMEPPQGLREHNCKYFQTKEIALRECALLPGCVVDSKEFTYTITRKSRWCAIGESSDN